jgi:hypothetical protein
MRLDEPAGDKESSGMIACDLQLEGVKALALTKTQGLSAARR